MNRSQTNLLLSMVFAISSLHAAPPPDDQPMPDPGMLAGPWEAKSGENLVGLHLCIDTILKGSVEYLSRIMVRVNRAVGLDWGWFDVDGQTGTWDGTRLTISYKETKIDLVFDRKQQTWSGTFAVNGPSRTVRLERPAGEFGNRINSFLGTWKSDESGTPGCLHVALRGNGAAVAWLDRRVGRRYGEELDNLAITGSRIAFRLSNTVYSYIGTLVDGQRIEGAWSSGLQAPYDLMRSPVSACASLPIPASASGSPFLLPPPAKNQQP